MAGGGAVGSGAAGARAVAYDELATSLRRRADLTADDAGRIARSLPADTMLGGPVRAVIDDALGAALRNGLRIAAELQALAAEATRRAAVCRSYELALVAHADAVAAWTATDPAVRPDRAPVAPAPPATWVLA